MRSLNFETYLTETRVDQPAARVLTKGLTIKPLSLGFGGTNSTICSFDD